MAMKLIGTERQSHVMDLVVDQAIAVFAGIHVVPKTLLPGGLLFARRPTGLPAIEGGLAGTGRAGRPAAWPFFRPPQHPRQLQRGAFRKALRFQPEPFPEGNSGLSGATPAQHLALRPCVCN